MRWSSIADAFASIGDGASIKDAFEIAQQELPLEPDDPGCIAASTTVSKTSRGTSFIRCCSLTDEVVATELPGAKKALRSSFLGDVSAGSPQPVQRQGVRATSFTADIGTKPCPEDWRVWRDRCIAPASYHGPCAPIQDLRVSHDDKVGWERKCNVRFTHEEIAPARACKPTGDCPKDWTLVGQSVKYCQAPRTYDGMCRPVMSAGEIMNIGPGEFAKSCGVQFECEPEIPTPPVVEEEVPFTGPRGPVLSDGVVFDHSQGQPEKYLGKALA